MPESVALVNSLDIVWSYPEPGQVAGAVVRVVYDPSASGLTSTTVQDALDELDGIASGAAADASAALPKAGGTMTGGLSLSLENPHLKFANTVSGHADKNFDIALVQSGASSGFSVAKTDGFTWVANLLRFDWDTEELEVRGQIRTLPGADLGTSGTLTLALNGASLRSTGVLTGDIAFEASNRAVGRSVTLRVRNGGTERALSFPAGWVFVGEKPASITEDAVGILTITAFGADDEDVVAAWAASA